MDRMNIKRRHEHRRLQTPAHPCWCAIHKGANSPAGYGHSIGDGMVALWRHVSPGNVVETGPWFDESGIIDATISRTPAVSHGPQRFRVTKHIRGLRAESRSWERLARQNARNPKFPPKAYLVALAGWHAAGAIVTPDGPVFHARIVSA